MLVYLASPYTHDNPEVMDWRYREVCRYAARFVCEGTKLFCPIAHCHPMAAYGAPQCDGEFWARVNEPFLEASTELWVLMLPAWGASKGIWAESQYMLDAGRPVEYIKWAEGVNGPQP